MSLVEVVVAGLILVVAVLGAGAAFSGASARSAETRTRAVASSLAAQDQARMKTLKVFASAGFTQDRTVTTDGGTYTVRSVARWLNDAGPSASCEAQTGSQPAAIQITSTVTSGVASLTPSSDGRIDPVEIRSLVSPPRQAYSGSTGMLAIPVVGRDRATPVEGVTVSISGPQSASIPTNAAGCAVFGQLPAGTYTITLDQDGWVGVTGAQRLQATEVVTAGALARETAIAYQPAGSADVSIVRGTGTTAPASVADAVVVRNDAIASGAKVVALNPAATSANIAQLFPSSQNHTVYPGRCVPADTTKGTGVSISPGTATPVTVSQAPLDAVLSNGSANQLVYAIWRESGCSQRVTLQRGSGSTTTIARANGDTGLPFGAWALCTNVSATQYVIGANFTLTSATSNTRQTLNAGGTRTSGQCPTA